MESIFARIETFGKDLWGRTRGLKSQIIRINYPSAPPVKPPEELTTQDKLENVQGIFDQRRKELGIK